MVSTVLLPRTCCVLDVLLWSIYTESLRRDLKLRRSIAKAEERQEPNQDSDSLWLGLLQSTRIHGLGVVSEPVSTFVSVGFGNEGYRTSLPEVDSLDHH